MTLAIAATAHPPIDHILVARLLAEALAMLDEDRPGARRNIEHAYTVVQREPAAPSAKGSLADWQVRRVERFIRSQISSALRIREVAAIVKLSPSYFSRAFKASKGVPYSDFVVTERIALAKHLLLSTDRPIAEIALMCGFSDQSHLTRLFRAMVGQPPASWRRQLQLPLPHAALAA